MAATRHTIPSNTLVFEELEPRLLFSADGTEALAAEESGMAPSQELVLVNDSVQEYELLRASKENEQQTGAAPELKAEEMFAEEESQ